MTLRPSHLLLNRTGRSLQLCISEPLLPAPAAAMVQPCARQRTHLPALVEGAADSTLEAVGRQAVMVAAPRQGTGSGAGTTALRVWLGPGNGWSLPVPLGSPAPQV